jgi:hypothetical protein
VIIEHRIAEPAYQNEAGYDPPSSTRIGVRFQQDHDENREINGQRQDHPQLAPEVEPERQPVAADAGTERSRAGGGIGSRMARFVLD